MKEYSGKKISTFKERFSELCDTSPMNDTEIAESLHVSRQTVSAWKTGSRSPKEPTIIAIANYFEVDVGWLMGFDVEKRGNPQNALDHGRWKRSMENGNVNLFVPKTNEARIISGGIDKMPPDRREQALKVLQTIFADYFDGGDDHET